MTMDVDITPKEKKKKSKKEKDIGDMQVSQRPFLLPYSIALLLIYDEHFYTS